MTNEISPERLVSCPLCGHINPILKRQIESRLIINGWQNEFGIDISENLQKIDLFGEFDCPGCNLTFFFPPSLAAPAELYFQLGKYPWYYMPRKWEHDIAIQSIMNGQRALEIGCGAGDFVARMIDVGIKAEGIELNTRAVTTAHSRGLPVDRQNLEDAARQLSGAYDVVCSFQVLEHVSNPFEFINSCCDLLKPGGQLIIGLPNANSFLKYQFNLLDLPPHHMSRWTKSVLKCLINLFPLQLIDINVEPLASYHVKSFVHAYMTAIVGKKRSEDLVFSRLQRVLVALIHITKIRKILVGQTLYASYRRI